MLSSNTKRSAEILVSHIGGSMDDQSRDIQDLFDGFLPVQDFINAILRQLNGQNGAVAAFLSQWDGNQEWLDRFESWSNAAQVAINQVADILGGHPVTPINEAVQGVKDWFNTLPSDFTQFLTGLSNLDATKLIGTIASARIPGLAASKITSGIFDVLRVPNLDAGKIISGIFTDGLIPTLAASKIGSGILDILRVPDLDAEKITTGAFAQARITGLTTELAAKLTALSELDATKLINTIASARIPSLAASKITSGIFDVLRVPDLTASKIVSGILDVLRVPDLDAGKITTGAFGQSRITGLTSDLAARLTALSDLDATKLINTIATARIPNLATSKITSGIFDILRVPDLAASKIVSGVLDTLRVPDLDAAKITSGTFAQSFVANLTTDLAEKLTALSNLDATKLINMIADARIPGLDVSKITSGVFSDGFIPTLAASKIGSGILDLLRVPNLPASKTTSGSFDALRIPTLDASKIGTGALDALRIPSLDASKIASGIFNLLNIPTLPGSKIGVDPSNLLEDPDFEIALGTGGWAWRSGPSTAVAYADTAGLPGRAMRLAGSSSEVSAQPVGWANVEGGERYFLSVKSQNQLAPTGTPAFMRVAWFDQAKVEISFSDLTLRSGSWTTYTGSFLAPANARFAKLIPIHANTATSGHWWWGRGVFRRMSNTEMLWDNAVTNAKVFADLDATKIAAGLLDILRVPDLDAGKIVTGALNILRVPDLSASKIVSGILDVLRVPDLDAGKIASGQLPATRIVDLDASKIVGGVLDALRVPTLDASKIGSGTLADALIPALAQSKIVGLATDLAEKLTAASNLDATKLINMIADARIPSLAASKIASGVLDILRVPALDASKIASGTLAALRIPALDASKITSGEFGEGLIPTLAQSKITGLVTSLGEKLTALSNLDATKLINTIADARIPALAASKITSGILDILRVPDFDAAKVVSGALNALRIPSLDASKIGSGQLGSARIADLDASKIASGTLGNGRIPGLDFSKIVSGFLNMDRIAANAITVGKVKVTDFTNIAVGSNFEDPLLVPWTLGAPWSLDNTVAHAGKASLKCDGTKTGLATLQTDAYVQEGESYHFEFWAMRDEAWDGTSSNSKLRIGDQVNSHLYSLGFQRANMPTAGTWYKREYDLVIPAGVTKLNITLNNDATTGNAWIDDIVIRRMTDVETIVDGAISNIKLGSNISAAKIVNGVLDVLRVPALDASKITSGTFAQSFIVGLTSDLAEKLTAASNLDAGKLINMIADARIPDLSASKIVTGVLDILRVPALDASKIASGTLTTPRIPALDASKITSGEFGAGLIPALAQSKIVGLATDLAEKLTAASSLDAGKLINTIAAARIPGLDVTKIISGVFGEDFIPSLAASKIGSGILDVLRVPDLDAGKIASGTFEQSKISGLVNDLAAKLTALSSLDATKLINTIASARIPNLATSKITSGIFDVLRVPDLAASKITAGLFDLLRLPDLPAAKINSGTMDVARIPALDASKITSGALDALRLPDLDASKITTGSLPQSRVANLIEQFQDTWDFVWQGAGNTVGEGTGKTVADVRERLAALFGKAATAESKVVGLEGRLESIQNVVFIRSGRPLYEGIDPTGEATYPWSDNVDVMYGTTGGQSTGTAHTHGAGSLKPATEYNITSGFSRIGFIRLGYAGVRSQVSFVGRRVTTGDIAVDVYRMNDDGSMPEAVWTTGNLDGSFRNTSQQVQVDIPDMLFDVGDVVGIQLRVLSGSYSIIGKSIFKPDQSVLFPFRPLTIGAVRNLPSNGPVTQAQMDGMYSNETPYIQIGSYDENINKPRRFGDNFGGGDTSPLNLGSNWMVTSRDQNGNNTKVGWRISGGKAIVGGTAQILFVSTLATFTIPMTTDDIVVEVDASDVHADRPGGIAMHIDSAGHNFCAFMIKSNGVSFRSFSGVGFNTDVERAATNTSGNNVHWKVTFSSVDNTYRAYKNYSTTPILEWADNTHIIGRQENKRYGGIIGSHSGIFPSTWSAEFDNFDIHDAAYSA